MARTLLVLAALAGLLIGGTAMAGTTAEEPKDVHWTFEGPFGHYDQAQLQRGYKVYHEVCSSCHSMNLVAFRNLGDPGGCSNLGFFYVKGRGCEVDRPRGLALLRKGCLAGNKWGCEVLFKIGEKI